MSNAYLWLASVAALTLAAIGMMVLAWNWQAARHERARAQALDIVTRRFSTFSVPEATACAEYLSRWIETGRLPLDGWR